MADMLVVLGRQPELSFAELVARAHRDEFTLHPLLESVVRLESNTSWQTWFPKFGGLVKCAEVVLEAENFQTLVHQLAPRLSGLFPPEGKIVLGVSVYGGSHEAQTARALAIEWKELLRLEGRSVRFCRNEQGQLSSVVVAKQGLLTKGAELLIIRTPRNTIAARTVAVQAFEEFSERDYGRPGRNPRSGMLPPKLARMMVNLSGVKPTSTLLDPFCGSGTILQEAQLMGFKNIVGSDAAPRAIADTEQNLAWIQRHHQHELPRAKVLHSNILELQRHLPAGSVDVVVTEPYLGPPLAGNEDSARIQSIQQQLAHLYDQSFSVFARLLRSSGRVVFLMPVFFVGTKPMFLLVLDMFLAHGFRLLQPFPPDFLKLYKPKLTFRNTLLYRRPGQRLGREIVLFERK